MDFLENSILNLSKDRLIFHSEDDLKLSLAITIKESNPDFQLRLERPLGIEMVDRNSEKIIARAPIDIMIKDDKGNSIPIELKYKTKKTEVSYNGEDYFLTNHGATDVGRYSFRKDLYRIERCIVQNPNCSVGYVFILTNDQAYFENNVFQKHTIDKNFSVHHGGLINKNDSSWNYDSVDIGKYQLDNIKNIWRYSGQPKKHWTCEKELFYKLDLLKDYQVEWKNYSIIQNSVFKYCLFKIER